jgi:hypothetical protein
MADLAEPVLFGNCVCPAFYRRSRDLDRPTADAANEVVVMPGGAAAVRRLTLVGSDGIKITRVAHELQGPIDRCQANAFAVMSQVVVNLLCRPKVMSIGQNFFDRGALAGPALTARRLGPLRFRHGLVVI